MQPLYSASNNVEDLRDPSWAQLLRQHVVSNLRNRFSQPQDTPELEKLRGRMGLSLPNLNSIPPLQHMLILGNPQERGGLDNPP